MRVEEHNLCVKGFDALVAALGIVDAERFVMIMNRDAGDYTEWRRNHFYQNISLRDLAERARQAGEAYRNQRGLANAI